ncbi:MAG TPA: hypothetical protein DHW42_11700 [Candidatus Marinimicrobia bacterium]|nr:hypothetical protein [Candidatus Neomarinimicrobiota bacterium]
MKLILDKCLSRALFLISAGIVVYWLIKGIVRLYHWFVDLPDYSTDWWLVIGRFCVNNLSIIIVVYLVICLQVAGIAEFKNKKNFLKAFLLAIVLTPPLMMAIWGRKTQPKNKSK